jgi:D-glycero-D-manno-heptose 1,7-bisphosphate phosphatase
MTKELVCPDLLFNHQLVKGAKTLIFDRDGTINVDPGYVYRISDFEFTGQFLRIVHVLKEFKGNLCVITNQGGVRLGKYLQSDSQGFTEYLISATDEIGVFINLVLSCYHHNLDNCNFRKPAPGMLKVIEDMTQSGARNYLFVGNDQKDAEAAAAYNFSYLDINSTNLEAILSAWVSKS